MYDKLIERLRECTAEMNVEKTLWHQAADAIEELQQITTHYEEESKGWWLAACDAKEERERLKEQLDNAEIENIKLKEEFAKYRGKHRWIPVTERLPENDVHVLLSCKCGAGAYVCDGFHTEKYSVPMPFYEDIDADYDEETDEYYFPEGWWESIKNWDDYSCVAIEDTITHWMPLPQPPKDGET